MPPQTTVNVHRKQSTRYIGDLLIYHIRIKWKCMSCISSKDSTYMHYLGQEV